MNRNRLVNLPDLPPPRPGEVIADAIAGIEGHIAAGDRNAASTALAAIKPVIESGIAFVRDLPHLNLYSGLALACKIIGRQGDSKTHATRALIADPADLLGHALLPRPELIHVRRQLVHHQQRDIAKRIFDAAQSISANEEYAFYADILDYQESLKAAGKQVTANANGGRARVLNVVIWGDAFVAKFLRYTLPSLLAEQNLLALAASGGVTFDIHTTQADIPLLRRSGVTQAAQRFATFTYTEFPDRFCVSTGLNRPRIPTAFAFPAHNTPPPSRRGIRAPICPLSIAEASTPMASWPAQNVIWKTATRRSRS